MRRQLACIFAASLLAVSAAVPAYAAETEAETDSGVEVVDAVTEDGESVEEGSEVEEEGSEAEEEGSEAEGTGYTMSPGSQPAPEITANDGDSLTVDGNAISIQDLIDGTSEYALELTTITDVRNGDAANDEIADALQEAVEEISANDTSLTFATEEDQAAFDEKVAAAEDNGKVLVCSNIFELSVVNKEDGSNIDGEVGNITVTLAVDNADDIVLVMHRPNGEWAVADFVNNGDGTITLTLPNLCAIAFFVEGEAAEVYPGPGVKDPGSDTPTPSDPTEPVVEPENPNNSGSSNSPTTVVGVRERIVPGSNGSKISARPDTDEGAAPLAAAGTAGAAAAGTAAVSTAAGGDVASPNTGVAGNGVFLLSGIVTALAGVTLVVKAKKE